MSFQNNVLYVAIVVFVILMVFIAVMMNSAQKNQAFPPQIGSCPDYWQKLNNGTCQNIQGLGKNCASPFDFRKMTNKQKYAFAKGCNITWDGITNAETTSGALKYA